MVKKRRWDSGPGARAAPALGIGIGPTSPNATGASTAAADDDEIDPLDAFMDTVKEDLAKEVSGVTGATSSLTAGGAGDDDDEEEEARARARAAAAAASASSGKQDYFAMLRENAAKGKKELKPVDHSQVDYEPVTKDLYIESREIADMTPEEAAEARDSLGSVTVRGCKDLRPVRTFAQAGLGSAVSGVLRNTLGFEEPTPIQACAFPLLLSGRDLIGIARTGSGKTLAFALPMLRHVVAQRPLSPGEGPIAIVMAPTRELAVQIHGDMSKFVRALGLRCMAAYGGTPIGAQIAELKRGAEVVVCTPGRMIDLLCANSGRVVNLRRTSYVVLDEADRMFDLGFEPQVLKILGNVRPDRQVAMFSATFPKALERVAKRALRRPAELIVGGRSVVCADVTQSVEVLADHAKFAKLLGLLGRWDGETSSVLVFVETQQRVDNLYTNLLKRGYSCLTLHAGVDQADRDSTLADFKSGVAKLLIATSVAARGLDVKDLNLVVNYDVPNHYEDYVHRCGRTGRAGRKGRAVTFVTKEEYVKAPDIAAAVKASGAKVTPELQELVDRAEQERKARAEARSGAENPEVAQQSANQPPATSTGGGDVAAGQPAATSAGTATGAADSGGTDEVAGGDAGGDASHPAKRARPSAMSSSAASSTARRPVVGGFGGSGYKFDERESKARKELIEREKAALGVGGAANQADEGEDVDPDDSDIEDSDDAAIIEIAPAGPQSAMDVAQHVAAIKSGLMPGAPVLGNPSSVPGAVAMAPMTAGAAKGIATATGQPQQQPQQQQQQQPQQSQQQPNQQPGVISMRPGGTVPSIDPTAGMTPAEAIAHRIAREIEARAAMPVSLAPGRPVAHGNPAATAAGMMMNRGGLTAAVAASINTNHQAAAATTAYGAMPAGGASGAMGGMRPMGYPSSHAAIPGLTSAGASMSSAGLMANIGGGGGSGPNAPGTEPKKQYVTELEINDYPQQARWKVTRKDALEDIVEWTRCAVTVRGNHYPPGKQPRDGDRKLYISIEGDKREMVKQARKEVRRRVEEAAMKAAPDKNSTRYSVI